MAVKKPGLGKRNSLGMLLSNVERSTTSNEKTVTTELTETKERLAQLPVEKIRRGKYQPRRYIDADALQDLAESIKAQGIIQPIVVRPISDSEYEIIAGERRWRAAQIAGLDQVPVVVKPISDEATIAMALIENIQRQDLNSIEEAMALQRLIDEFQMTHQEVAGAVGKSRTGVTNILRLLSLNEDVKALLVDGKIDSGHAKVLLGLVGYQQSQVARTVAMKGLSVRETEVLVKQMRSTKDSKQEKKTIDPNIRHLENELGEKLGAKINIDHKPTGKGKLLIHYNTLDELQGILDHIN